MRTIRIIAASRLHFGLLAPGGGTARRFGGIGVMIEQPSLRLVCSTASHFSVDGPGADRVREFAHRWLESHAISEEPNCRFIVESLPPMHSGLGVGTQLGLSVAQLLCEFTGESTGTPADIAWSVGRGLRSAVGTYGFLYGGLIVERGKGAEDRLAPFESRAELPDRWRWVLVRPMNEVGLHGSTEERVFEKLRQPSYEAIDQLSQSLHDELLPSAERADFSAFSASLYRFGYRSGLYFADIQGGAYNGPRLQRIVETIRSLGIEGVGQSSWGPTIFALCADQAAAEQLVARLEPLVGDTEFSITATANHGARVIGEGVA